MVGWLHLSVSSIGSSPLQQILWFLQCRTSIVLSVSSIGSSPLQLLNETARTFPASRLSVSSIGSSPLQPGEARFFATFVVTFQYPPSDRAHCNRLCSCRYVHNIKLSVSSIGSSPLQQRLGICVRTPGLSFQYPPSDRAHCNGKATTTTPPTTTAFSILHRIEPTATKYLL